MVGREAEAVVLESVGLEAEAAVLEPAGLEVEAAAVLGLVGLEAAVLEPAVRAAAAVVRPAAAVVAPVVAVLKTIWPAPTGRSHVDAGLVGVAVDPGSLFVQRRRHVRLCALPANVTIAA